MSVKVTFTKFVEKRVLHLGGAPGQTHPGAGNHHGSWPRRTSSRPGPNDRRSNAGAAEGLLGLGRIWSHIQKHEPKTHPARASRDSRQPRHHPRSRGDRRRALRPVEGRRSNPDGGAFRRAVPALGWVSARVDRYAWSGPACASSPRYSPHAFERRLGPTSTRMGMRRVRFRLRRHIARHRGRRVGWAGSGVPLPPPCRRRTTAGPSEPPDVVGPRVRVPCAGLPRPLRLARPGKVLSDGLPELPQMRRDALAVERAYNEADPAAVAQDMVANCRELAALLGQVTGSEWQRVGLREGEELSVAWMANNTLHEAQHHLMDFDRSLGRLEGSGGDCSGLASSTRLDDAGT